MLAFSLGLADCAHTYDPPLATDHESPRYKADLHECARTSNEQVRLVNASTLGSWVLSPFTGAAMVHTAIRECMLKKGYRE
jgi:hypothetical protein